MWASTNMVKYQGRVHHRPDMSKLWREGSSALTYLTLGSWTWICLFCFFLFRLILLPFAATTLDIISALSTQERHPLPVTPHARGDHRDEEQQDRRRGRHTEHNNKGQVLTFTNTIAWGRDKCEKTLKTKLRKNSAIFASFNFLTLHLLFSCGVPPSDVARDEHDVENEK